MTDKIIIDGIDVSRCDFYNVEDGTCREVNENTTQIFAILITALFRANCYYKQLARAKDKINYMEEGIKTVENARNDLERELKRKEQKLQAAKKFGLPLVVSSFICLNQGEDGVYKMELED